MRKISSVLVATAIASSAWLQGHAQTCFLSADFEAGAIPSGWTNTSVTIVATGEPTNAWTVGTAAEANANTYFPVLDLPIGNRFAMANDDAAPCDCVMNNVSLTSPVLDLTGRSNVALECRVFHEMTLGAGDALIEASTNGSDWTVLDTLDAAEGNWQAVFLDVSAYDGETGFQFRFRWSDGGGWSSGLAVDDVCLLERSVIDLSLLSARFGNDTISPFILGDQAVRYSQLPLEQAGPIIVSVEVMNRGTTVVQNIGVQVSLTLDGAAQGSFDTPTVIALDPGERATLVVSTGWVANGVGGLLASTQITMDETDEVPADNMRATELRITGPGWDDGYGAMAQDAGAVQGGIGSELGFIAANRMEIMNEGSTAKGASVVIGVDSQLDEEIRMILMDDNFAFIDTSARHTIVQGDIDLAYGGGAIYLPFVTTPTLVPGDYFVGYQRLSGSGHVSVATSGNCVPGSAAFMVGASFDITWSSAIPMVRLHLSDYGVGMDDLAVDDLGSLSLVPNPVSDLGRLVVRIASPMSATLAVMDVTGRELISQDLGTLPAGQSEHQVEVAHLPPGTYALVVQTPRGRLAERMVVTQ